MKVFPSLAASLILCRNHPFTSIWAVALGEAAPLARDLPPPRHSCALFTPSASGESKPAGDGPAEVGASCPGTAVAGDPRNVADHAARTNRKYGYAKQLDQCISRFTCIRIRAGGTLATFTLAAVQPPPMPRL